MPGSVKARAILLATSMVAIVAVSTGIGIRLAWRAGYRAAHDEAMVKRGGVVFQRAVKQPAGGVVVLGDSIVELQSFTTLCGLPVFNAGISGATTAQVARKAAVIVKAARPAIVVVAVGINDMAIAQRTPEDVWEAQYRDLLASLKAPRIIVMGIQPVEPAKRWGQIFETAAIGRDNEALARIAAAAGAVYVPPWPSAEGLTFDGVHPTADGDRRWQASIAPACPR